MSAPRDDSDVQADRNMILETLLKANELVDHCYVEHGSNRGLVIDFALDALKRLRNDARLGITWPAVEPIDGEVDALRSNVIAAAKILVYKMRERTASTATWQALGDAVESLEAGAPRQACKRDSTKQCSSPDYCNANGCQL